MQGQAVRWKRCGACCCRCWGIGVASQAKAKLLAKQRVASVCKSLFSLSVWTLAVAGPGHHRLLTPGKSCACHLCGDRDQLHMALPGHGVWVFPAGAGLEAVFCEYL